MGAFVFWRMSYFLRDPHRQVPPGSDTLVAAADGYVVYVKRVERGEVPIAVKGRRSILLSEYAGVGTEASGYLIGTYMTERSVHRNRAPIAGEVVLRRHRPALPINRSMARMSTNVLFRRAPYDEGSEHLITNERLTIGIRPARGGIVYVTQIADIWINRIVARVEPGQRLGKGEQYGLIRFGSQCDVFLPDDVAAQVSVCPGQYVYAGETVLARAVSGEPDCR
ncbi:phosphatidylserine decarboxylase [Kribbella sandramycini]|uniref:Phosphatidylserine decarboxylase n=1 Tax=Kribbella sandramycini TaxID=60450 RepID=A0A841S8X4_9ACTN|nr:phosphatidylserine decarboxylase [Kribbella sandramycini]